MTTVQLYIIMPATTSVYNCTRVMAFLLFYTLQVSRLLSLPVKTQPVFLSLAPTYLPVGIQIMGNVMASLDQSVFVLMYSGTHPMKRVTYISTVVCTFLIWTNITSLPDLLLCTSKYCTNICTPMYSCTSVLLLRLRYVYMPLHHLQLPTAAIFCLSLPLPLACLT